MNLKSLVVENDNADVFGTLSPSTAMIAIPSLESKLIDEGDLKEHKKISFVPDDLKSSKEFSESILQLVNSKKLKEALQLLEVEMKKDQVKPNKSIYSILIGACGRAGYTKKAFSLYNQVNTIKFQSDV